MDVENLFLSQYNVMPIEKHHGGIAAAYDAQLSLPQLAPSPNGPDVAGWYLDTEMLSWGARISNALEQGSSMDLTFASLPMKIGLKQQ